MGCNCEICVPCQGNGCNICKGTGFSYECFQCCEELPEDEENYLAPREAATPGICCTREAPCADHQLVVCTRCGGTAYVFQVDRDGVCDECTA